MAAATATEAHQVPSLGELRRMPDDELAARRAAQQLERLETLVVGVYLLSVLLLIVGVLAAIVAL